MKYEFHVGDYVEIKDGRVGYINFVGKCSTEMAAFNFTIHTIHNKEPSAHFYDTYSNLPQHFNRIGQYNFTKKDEGKIEKIDVKKAGSVFTGRETAIIDTISNKVNELIEVVNRLEDTFNEMV